MQSGIIAVASKLTAAIVSAVAALAIACGGVAKQPAAPAPADAGPLAVEVAKAHTVKLQDPGCTAVRIGNGHVLTAKHCVKGGYNVGEVYAGYKVEYIDDVDDFAVLADPAAVAPVKLVVARDGEHLYSVGYPVDGQNQAGKRTITDGVYTGATYQRGLALYKRHTAYTYRGNSGGGIWNDRGELLGIHVESNYLPGGTTRTEASGLMVPASRISRALAKL